VASLAAFRSAQNADCLVHLPFCPGFADPFHFAQHRPVQLAGGTAQGCYQHVSIISAAFSGEIEAARGGGCIGDSHPGSSATRLDNNSPREL